MASRSYLHDTLIGLAIVTVLVAIAAWVVTVIDAHLKEHGHNQPDAVRCVVCAERGDLHAAGQVVEGGHASFFATGSVSDAVRRRRNDSDTAL